MANAKLKCFTTYVVETKFAVKTPGLTKPKFLVTINKEHHICEKSNNLYRD